ncbi:MAG TPA: hypothetical protein VHO50_05835 [Bacteroidales bacterium]|nr:hypothetical protein [Bacteroidales bacterium]
MYRLIVTKRKSGYNDVNKVWGSWQRDGVGVRIGGVIVPIKGSFGTYKRKLIKSLPGSK